MNALCLAAGKGTRFGELGRYLQKCMYPIGLRPFLAFSVENLLASGAVTPGVDQLVVVVGHHGEQVRRYFGDAVDGLDVHYVEQAAPRGTGHALSVAAHAVTDANDDAPWLMWLADAYVKATQFAALATHPMDTVLTLAPAHPGENPTVRVDVDGERIVRAFQGSSDRYDAGIWKLPRSVMMDMADVADNGEIRMLANLQRMIEAGLTVGWVEAEEWLHLGGTAPTPEANVAGVEARIRLLHALPDVRTPGGVTERQA